MGEFYVVFTDGLDSVVVADTLGSYATVIYGAAAGDKLGESFIPYDAPDYITNGIAVGFWDNDNVPDLAIGTGQANDDSGAVYVFFGDNLSPGDTIYCGNAPGTSHAPDITFTGSSTGDQLGASIAIADLDNDGNDDLIVGAPGVDSGRGEVYIAFGGARASLTSSVDVSIAGEDQDDNFGGYLGAGNFDGDDYLDLAVTARLAEPPGFDESGETTILFGRSRSDWLSQTPFDLATDKYDSKIFKLAGPDDEIELAHVVFGNIDNDEFSDITFGAYDAPGTNAEPEAGQMYIMEGSDVWKSGAVSSNTTWSGNIFVTGDMSVAQGVTLTIDAGTDVFIWPTDWSAAGDDTNLVEFSVAGALDINGTSDDPVRFLVWSDDLESTERDTWQGISIDSSGVTSDFLYVEIKNAITGIEHRAPVNAQHLQIENCEVGIESYNDLTLNTSRISSVSDYCVYLRDGVAVLSNDTLADSDQDGLNAEKYAASDSIDITISSSIISDNDAYGVHCQDGVYGLDITMSTISGNYIGLNVCDGFQAVIGATVSQNNTGILTLTGSETYIDVTLSNNTTHGAFLNSSDDHIDESTINDNGVGVYYTGSGLSPLIEDSEFEDNSTGIYCNGLAAGLIQNNTITSNTYGVKSDTSTTPELKGNTLTHNTTAVIALKSGLPDLGDTGGGTGGGNVFNRNTYDVSNGTSGTTIMAEDNCWQGGTPKIIGVGSVDTSPHQSSGCPTGTSVSEGELGEPLPTVYALANTFPNPFNPTITVRYDVPAPGGDVAIKVYDVRGKLVTSVVDGRREPGRHAATWTGLSSSGTQIASGVYFVKMTAGEFQQTRKVVLLK